MLDFQTRLLKRAVEICGGRDAARSRLGVSEHSLELWMEGRARLPNAVFLRAADIVLADDIARASNDRRREPRMEDPRDDAANLGRG